MHCNFAPYKHAVIFLKKNHFLLYILPSGCLYVVENAITPRVRRLGATSPNLKIERQQTMSNIGFHIKNGVVVGIQLVAVIPHPEFITTNHSLANPAWN